MSRYSPGVKSESNPLDKGSLGPVTKIDSIVGAEAIQKIEFDSIISLLKSTSVNEERLKFLEEEKTPYLFSSSQLAELIELTPSVKTRLAMITMLGTRLIDPKAKVEHFLALFRFSQEKEQVTEILKARTHFLASNAFRRPSMAVSSEHPSSDNLSEKSDLSEKGVKPFAGIKGLAPARAKVARPVAKSRVSVVGSLEQSTSEKRENVEKDRRTSLGGGKTASRSDNSLATLATRELYSDSKLPRYSAPDLSRPQLPSKTAIAALMSSEKEEEVEEVSATSDDKIKPQNSPIKPIKLPLLDTESYFPSADTISSGNNSVKKSSEMVKNDANTNGNSGVINEAKSEVIRSNSIGNVDSNNTNGNRYGFPWQPSQPSVTTSLPNAVSKSSSPSKQAPNSQPSSPRSSFSTNSESGSQGKVARMIKALTKFSKPCYRDTTTTEKPRATSTDQSGILLETDLNSEDIKTDIETATESDETKDWVEVPSLRPSLREDQDQDKDEAKDQAKIQLMDQAKVNRDQDKEKDQDMDDDNETIKTWRKSRSQRKVKQIAEDFKRLSERVENPNFDSCSRAGTPDLGSSGKIRPRSADYGSLKLNRSSSHEGAGRNSSFSGEPEILGDIIKRNSVKEMINDFSKAVLTTISYNSSSYCPATSSKDSAQSGDGNEERDGNGPLFTYSELVRMNFIKRYDGIKQSELLFFMFDSEFYDVVGMGKDEFRAQPSWRQVQKKKSLLLF